MINSDNRRKIWRIVRTPPFDLESVKQGFARTFKVNYDYLSSTATFMSKSIVQNSWPFICLSSSTVSLVDVLFSSEVIWATRWRVVLAHFHRAPVLRDEPLSIHDAPFSCATTSQWNSSYTTFPSIIRLSLSSLRYPSVFNISRNTILFDWVFHERIIHTRRDISECVLQQFRPTNCHLQRHGNCEISINNFYHQLHITKTRQYLIICISWSTIKSRICRSWCTIARGASSHSGMMSGTITRIRAVEIWHNALPTLSESQTDVGTEPIWGI